MHPTYIVNNREAVALIISDNANFIENLDVSAEEFDNGNAVQVYRACTDELEAADEETRTSIMLHHSWKLACYYNKPMEYVWQVEHINDADKFRADVAMGLKVPSYGELVWHETGRLTPSITRELPEIYQVAYEMRKFAHKMHKKFTEDHAKWIFNEMINRILAIE